MGEVLQVSRSGLYASVPRHASAGLGAEEAALFARVKAIAAETQDSYGSRRMAKQRHDEGFAVGRCKARRLMPQAGVAVQRARPRHPITTHRRHGYGVAPNLLARQFDVERPDQVGVGDSTYVWTAEGWWDVSVLWDLYSRTVVGWAMSSHLKAIMVQEAWHMALGRRQPSVGLLQHSDRGSQDACHAYQRLLDTHGIGCRLSRQGECLDKAVAERFFGSLKRERTAHRYDVTRQDARDDVIDDIEMFYNSRRKHSYRGYLSPNDYEAFALVA
jgi:putative transposase